MKKLSGFSPVDLVFAIAFTAVLVSTAVLYINPVEQAKKARDSRVAKDVSLILSAIDKFYLANGRFSWAEDVSPQNFLPLNSWTVTSSPTLGIEKLIVAGFLPESFFENRILTDSDDAVYMAKGDGARDPVYACFLPFSEARREATGELFSVDFEKPFPSSGALPVCPADTTWEENDVCHICISR